jgi:aspartyl-tRNA(Asn)/glutamyl-tRNA(Gln) amidotransferase subunit A
VAHGQRFDSAVEIAAQVRCGARPAVDVVSSVLSRIGELEPTLHAWMTVDAEGAMAAARRIDAKVSAGEPVGPLAGVPVGVKDIIDVRGLPTTGCSPLFKDHVAVSDASCVAALCAADAVILGKTVCCELAGNDPSVAVNPWNAAHTPGGSSSGSAVAVAVGMCAVALGSQTGGSTLRPAAYTGVVGLKPTYDCVRLDGVLPFAPSFDTIGILARSGADASLVLDVLANHRPTGMPLVRRIAGQRRGDPPVPPRVGVIREYFFERATRQVQDHVTSIVEKLATAGAQVSEVMLPVGFAEHELARPTISGAELAAIYAQRFAHERAQFGPLIAQQIEDGLAVSAVRYVQAQRARAEFREQVLALAATQDVLLTPTAPSAAPADLTTTGSPAFQAVWTSVGLPSISIPAGVDPAGLPLGIQLIGQPMRDCALLDVARWCEGLVGADS